MRIVWKHHPLSMHKDAPGAHMASAAAHKQGQFWEYHDKLFANQRALKLPNLLKYAQELGLDMKQFEQDMIDQNLKKVLFASRSV